MAAKTTTPAGTSLQIAPLTRRKITLRLIGQTPLYFNSMSNKVKGYLLVGGGKKTAAERAGIKHNPEQEYRDSVYTVPGGETLLGFPAPGIKNAMATAALVTGGVKKTEAQKLLFVSGDKVKIWGRPYLKMDVVRSADIAKTPDIRTRAFLPEWGAEIEVQYTTPMLTAHSVVSLLANAGLVVGIGDFRQEKGRGSYGTFSVHAEDMDAETQARWDRIVAQGRDVQQEALDNPEPYDDETADLMEFLRQERARRAA